MPTTLEGTTYLTTPGTTVLDDGSSITGTVYLDAGHVLEISGKVPISHGSSVALGSSGGSTSVGGGRVIVDYPAELIITGSTLFPRGNGVTLLQNNGFLKVNSGILLETDVPFVNTRSVDSGGRWRLTSRVGADSSNRGVINNLGSLTLAGSRFYNAGTITNSNIMTITEASYPFEAGAFTNQAAGTYDLIGGAILDGGSGFKVFVNYGHLIKSDPDGSAATSDSAAEIDVDNIGKGGDITLESGKLELRGKYNVIQAEAVSGPGRLDVNSGAHVVIGVGTTLTMGSLSVESDITPIDRARAFLRLDEDLSYSGDYRQVESTLVLGTHTFTLDHAYFRGIASRYDQGPDSYSNIEGAGTLVITKSADVTGVNLLGSTVFRNLGAVSQTGSVGVGAARNGAASIVNAAGATWEIAGDGLIAGDSTKATFVNDGTLIKTPGFYGRSVVRPAVTGSAGAEGSIIVQGGSLELVHDVSGHQAMQALANSRLVLDAGASADTSFAFAGSGSALELGDGSVFKGTIAGFAAGDVLDVRSVAFSGQSAGYTSTGASSGTLNLTDGTHAAALKLLGSYAAGAFHLASDGHGGTAVTLA